MSSAGEIPRIANRTLSSNSGQSDEITAPSEDEPLPLQQEHRASQGSGASQPFPLKLPDKQASNPSNGDDADQASFSWDSTETPAYLMTSPSSARRVSWSDYETGTGRASARAQSSGERGSPRIVENSDFDYERLSSRGVSDSSRGSDIVPPLPYSSQRRPSFVCGGAPVFRRQRSISHSTAIDLSTLTVPAHLMADPAPDSQEEDCTTPRGTSWIASSGQVGPTSTVPFLIFVIVWILMLSNLGAVFFRVKEGVPYIDGLFTAIDSVTATGLATTDITVYSSSSKFMIALLMQLGSATMITLSMVLLKIRSLRPIVGYGTFNLKNYKRIPEWVVEYKASVYLARILVLYQLGVYCFYGLAMFIYISASPDARHLVRTTGCGCSRGGWVAFHVISGYCNAGFTLMPDSMASFQDHWFLNLCVCMVIVHGNIGLPIFLRWIVVFLNAQSKPKSSRKVYYRYLLLNGRKCTSTLFGSQQTWILLITQLVLIVVQLFATYFDNSLDTGRSNPTFGQMIFMAINTRHAGMASQPMIQERPATLVVYVVMMFLAPAPFVVAMNESTVGHVMLRPYRPAPHAEEGGRTAHSLSFTGSSPPAAGAAPGGAPHVNSNPMFEGAAGAGALGGATRGAGAGAADQSFRALSVMMASGAPPQDPDPEHLLLGEHHIHFQDTRLWLLGYYDDQPIPLSVRVGMRWRAVRFHVGRLASQAAQDTFQRDLFVLTTMWFFVLVCEGYSNNDPSVFATLFEMVSAYGNVGLTLGSMRHKDLNVAFSHDLSVLGKLLCMLVQVVGRTRSFPSMVDSALTVQSRHSDAESILQTGRRPPQTSPGTLSNVQTSHGNQKPENVTPAQYAENSRGDSLIGSFASDDDEMT